MENQDETFAPNTVQNRWRPLFSGRVGSALIRGTVRVDVWFRAEGLGQSAWKWTIRDHTQSIYPLADGVGADQETCKRDAEKALGNL